MIQRKLIKEAYHVTSSKNLPLILKEGLLPLVGERSIDIGEQVPRVYLFPTIDDMETALMNWLGEWYDEYEEETGEKEELFSLKVLIPDSIEIFFDETSGFECYSYKHIPSEYITVLKSEG